MKKLNELMRNNQNRLLLEVSDNIMGMNLDVLLNIAIVILFYGPFQKLPHTVKKKKTNSNFTKHGWSTGKKRVHCWKL